MRSPPPVPPELLPRIVKSDEDTRGDGAEACAKSVGNFDREAEKRLRAELDALGRCDGDNRTGRACWLIFIDYGRSVEDGWPLLKAWNARRHEPHDERELRRRMLRALDHKADARRGDKVWGVKVRKAKPRAPELKLSASGLLCLADVVEERIEWVWKGRIPLAKVTILDGDPGLGKSTMLIDLAARVTRGDRMPEDAHPPRPPADVVMMSAEDGAGDTIRPRARVAQADAQRIHLWIVARDEDGDEREPTVEDVENLERVIVETKAVLVVIDPFVAYLPDGKNSHSDHEMRRAIGPLARLAERTGAAILLVRHVKKGNVTKAIHGGGGSIGIVGAARSALLVAKDPEDETGETRVLAMQKSNLAREAPSLKYRVVEADGVGKIEWLGVSSQTADELVAARRVDREPTRTDGCVEWLRELLADGPKDSRDVKIAAEARGYGERVLRDARERLAVVTPKKGKVGKSQITYWQLPGVTP